MERVPPALAQVIGPLREADEYQRLQLQRQRGVYNLLTGLPGFFLVFMMNAGGLLPLSELRAGFLFMVASWFLFFWACSAPKSLLPWVRRRRPDWESPLVDSSLVKRAMEKQFWLQFPFWMAGTSFPVFLLLLVFATDAELTLQTMAAALAAIHAAGTASLAIQARWKNRDPLLSATFWFAVPFAVVPWLVDPHHFPSQVGLVVLACGLFLPPILVGLFRLSAPRRWLVR